MSNAKSNPEESSAVSRREALKTLAAVTGATALSTLPGQWESPVIEAGSLPAHAQTSPTTDIPFSSIVELGEPGSGRIPEQDRGWVAVIVNDGRVQAVQPAEAPEAQAAIFAVIPPIQVNERKFNLPAPTWTTVEAVTLSYTFISQTNVFPADGTELILYGVSGQVEFEANITATVVKQSVVFNFALPTGYNGVFYFSTNFVKTTITLTNKIELDIRRYYSVGIYAILAIYNEPLPNPPILLNGVVGVKSANTCNMGDGGIPGSQIEIALTYSGGNVTTGSVVNNFVLFFPSGSLFVFPTSANQTIIIPPNTIYTDDICMRFGTPPNRSSIIYYSVWITDANGRNSNSIGNFFLADPSLNSTDNDQPQIVPLQE